MAPTARLAADRRKDMATAETRIKKILRGRKAAPIKKHREGRGQILWPLGFLFSKFVRFFGLCKALSLRSSRTNKWQNRKVDFLNKKKMIERLKDKRKQVDPGRHDITFYWRDPDSKFCTICGEEKEHHLEPMCPYNYMSPDAYAPCKARLLLLGRGINSFPPRSGDEGDAPRQDDGVTLRRVRFLSCFVRVNNLPERCSPEQLVVLFNQFGPLWMWQFTLHTSGACRGFGYVTFRHREHAKEAIEALNCYILCDCKLRVDWAYPSA